MKGNLIAIQRLKILDWQPEAQGIFVINNYLFQHLTLFCSIDTQANGGLDHFKRFWCKENIQ